MKTNYASNILSLPCVKKCVFELYLFIDQPDTLRNYRLAVKRKYAKSYPTVIFL